MCRIFLLGRRSSISGTMRAEVCVLMLLLALTYARAHEDNDSPPRVALRKCCPLHQRLDHLAGQFDCVDNPSVDDPQDLPFAPGALINASALEAANFSTAGVPRWMHAEMPIWEATATDNRSDRPLLDALGGWVQLGPAPPCPAAQRKFFTWDSKSRYRFLSDGRLRFRPDSSQEHTVILQPNEYCTDVVQNYPIFFVCPCEKTLCLNKCCERMKELSVSVFRRKLSFRCVDKQYRNITWKPKIYPLDKLNESVRDVDYVILDLVRPTCGLDSNLVLLNEHVDPTRSMRILENGSAIFEGFGNGSSFPREVWCGDTSRIEEHRVQNALFCKELSILTRDKAKATAYGSMFVISAVFLALTLVVYGLLPALRRTAHARALLCHVAALLAGSVALAAGQLRPAVPSTVECHLLGFIIQYSMLAAFFWLNAVCIDVAKTFREILPTNSNASCERKFFYYSLYSWGCPAIISIVTAVLEFAEGLPEHLVRPHFGKRGCWMSSLSALFAYFYGPMALLLLVNLVLYCFTAVQLVRARSDTALVRGSSRCSSGSAVHDTKERLILHLKLFLLMGATWVMECVSAAVGQSDAYWYVTDAINMLRGVFVFIIFCCKRDVWRRLRLRMQTLCPKRKILAGSGQTQITGATPRGSGSSTTTRASALSLDAVCTNAAETTATGLPGGQKRVPAFNEHRT